MKKIYFFLSVLFIVISGSTHSQVVINEVYGGGGNAGSTYKNDFIELYNNGSTAVDLSGWSVQYNSAAGAIWTAANSTPLTGTIPAHGYFLIQEAAGAGGTTNLPTPDIANGTIAMAAGAGKVLLCNTTTLQAGANPTGAAIIDKVGYGGANGFEGAGPTATISATVSAQRTPVGTDTDNNSADFTTAAPTPSNSSTGFGTNVSVAAGTNAAEPASNGSFIVTLSTAAPAGGIAITYSLSGTATATSDYTDPQSGTITIPEGQSNGTINLNVINDTQFEPDETITITLLSATTPYTITTATAGITVFSDDINPAPLTGPLYVQDFNGWAASGTASLYSLLPNGWGFAETGTAANTTYTAGTGSGNGGDTYSFGSAAAPTDRAFGTLQSGSLVSTIGAQFVNNTGSTITSIRISYTGEEWRLGANNRPDQLDFQYSVDATGLSTGTWTDVNQLDFATPDTTTASLGALDGNIASHKVLTAYTITGLSLAPGAVFSIRWNDLNATGADDGLAIDDFSLESNPADNTPPVVSTYSPAANSTNAAINLTALITFNENIKKGSGNIVLKRKADDGVVQTIDVNAASVTVSGNAVSFPVSTLVNGTAYYFTIDNTAFADLANNNFAGISDNSTWTFTTSATTLFTSSFSTCTGGSLLSDGYIQYSVTGALTWACTSFGADAVHSAKGSAPYGVQMNGYDNSIPSNVQNEDWLISPAYDLTATTYPLLSFWSRTTFNGPPLQLKISTNYTGSGDPSLATWTDLNGRFPQQTSDTWTLSANINLSAFKQANVHIAWVYNSSNDDGARWTMDDITLDNSPTPPPPTIAASTGNIEFFFAAAGSTTTKQFTVLGNDLAGGAGINITSSDGSFLVSKDNASFAAAINFTEAEANNIAKTVYVQFAPAQNNKNFSGVLTVSTAGAADTVVAVKGTSIDPAKTLEVVNWNMEWFSTPDPTLGPVDKALQRQNAQTILQNIGADLFALVEVVDTAALGNIVRTMPGYSYIICNYGSHGNPFESGASPMNVLQKEAFVYKTSVFSNIDTTSLLSLGVNTSADLSNPDYNYWSSGRYPFMMTADVTLDGVTKRIHFVAVHAKANTSPTATAYARRKSGADDLHAYLNTTYPNDNIVILGDFNDDLDSTITDGISPRYSSYKTFTDDAASFYSPTLVGLSLTGKKSTVSYNDVIDHVLVSNEMQPFYMGASAAVLTDVSSLVTNYGNTTSDHYPVFTRYAFDAALLPVSLVSFVANKDGNTVKVSWTSSEEINSSAYIVQRSPDGISFTNIGTVTAKGIPSDYSFTDIRPLTGNNFYRLKPVDKDGKFVYSKVVKINFTLQPGIRISPNPASSYLYINLENVNAAVTLQLIDLNGKLVKQEAISQGFTNKTISLSGIAKGIYTVKLITREKLATQKLVIQ